MKAGNSSNAVVASRRKGTAASLNLFPTPPWATRALVEELLLAPERLIEPHMNCWEPSCGRGHMAIPLQPYFANVFATDVHDWGFGDVRNLDFTFSDAGHAPYPIHWVIGNPPFPLGEAFFSRAMQIASHGVALFLRMQWREGVERYNTIFGTDLRPTWFCPFAERVPLIEDVWDPEADSATAYVWFVWVKGRIGPTIDRGIRPGAEQRYSTLADLALATPGEAARRAAARKVANGAAP